MSYGAIVSEEDEEESVEECVQAHHRRKGGGGGLRHHLRHLHGSGDELHYLYILSCNNEASGNSMGYQTRMLLNS